MDEDFEFTSKNTGEWPYTPSLTTVRNLMQEDPNLLWRLDFGHLVNLIDDGIEAIEKLEAM